jgi:hypothetical protein
VRKSLEADKMPGQRCNNVLLAFNWNHRLIFTAEDEDRALSMPNPVSTRTACTHVVVTLGPRAIDIRSMLPAPSRLAVSAGGHAVTSCFDGA